MATPESNALLAMQLMGAPFQQYNAQNDARTNLQFKLAAMQREEQLKWELLTQQDERAFELAKMQAGREDKRNQTTLDWHKLQGEQNITREDMRDKTRLKSDEARDTAAEKRASAAVSARDAADIKNEFDRSYQIYADIMEAAKLPVQKREEFPETRAGLGQMQAEAAKAKRAYDENNLKRAAKDGAAAITRIQTNLDKTAKEISTLEKPTEADVTIAKANALKAVRAEITADREGTYQKLTAAQKDKGLAALAKGNTGIAEENLGPLAIQSYNSNYLLNLEALPNQKARMAAVAQAKRNQQALQGHHEKTFSSFAGSSGLNPFVSAELEKLMPQTQPVDPLLLLQGGGAPQSEAEKLRARTPAPTAKGTVPGAAGAAAGTEGQPQPAQPGMVRRGLSALMDITPGARTLQRTLGGAAGAVRAPSSLGDFNQSLMGLQRWYSPLGGAVEETEEIITPQQIDVVSLLQERPGGPFSEAELKALRAYNATQPQGPTLLQNMFPGAKRW